MKNIEESLNRAPIQNEAGEEGKERKLDENYWGETSEEELKKIKEDEPKSEYGRVLKDLYNILGVEREMTDIKYGNSTVFITSDGFSGEFSHGSDEKGASTKIKFPTIDESGEYAGEETIAVLYDDGRLLDDFEGNPISVDDIKNIYEKKKTENGLLKF